MAEDMIEMISRLHVVLTSNFNTYIACEDQDKEAPVGIAFSERGPIKQQSHVFTIDAVVSRCTVEFLQ